MDNATASPSWVNRLGRFLLRLAGFRVVGSLPELRSCLVVFAPHTSNWDFLVLLLARAALGQKISYLAKHTLFRPPFGWFFRLTSGIPVDRSGNRRVVETIAQEFTRRGDLWLAMAPEGTRARADHWKSGFYYIALTAKVPILLTAIDARRRVYVVGDLFHPSGDPEQDLPRLQAFYRDKLGFYPERAGQIRFRESEPPERLPRSRSGG